ncbi:MAG: hypothetical protein DMG93_17810 [Acidobacteria bacterium]|nr:MAG: hypothetical protein DMG93_17810 [Acidobacteriota bacterium]
MNKKSLLAASLILLFCLSAIALERQPASDYHTRREKLAAKLNGGVALLFAPPESGDEIYGYRPDNNFYYLTGWPEPGAAILIAGAQEAKDYTPARPYTEILFLPSRNYSQEKWMGPKLGPENPDAAKLTGFDRVASLDEMRNEIVKLFPSHWIKVYTDVPGPGEKSSSIQPLAWLENANAFPNGTSYEDVRPLVDSLRVIKDDGEIALIRKATNASIAAHFAAIRAIRPGVNEREIASLLEYEWGKRGCERVSYAPIVGSGINSTILHYSEDDNTIQNGDILVMDAAGEYSMSNHIYNATSLTPSTIPPPTTSTPIAKIYTASRWANTLSTVSGTTSDSMSTTSASIRLLSAPAWSSPSSLEFTFPKKSSVCASRICSTWTKMAS